MDKNNFIHVNDSYNSSYTKPNCSQIEDQNNYFSYSNTVYNQTTSFYMFNSQPMYSNQSCYPPAPSLDVPPTDKSCNDTSHTCCGAQLDNNYRNVEPWLYGSSYNTKKYNDLPSCQKQNMQQMPVFNKYLVDNYNTNNFNPCIEDRNYQKTYSSCRVINDCDGLQNICNNDMFNDISYVDLYKLPKISSKTTSCAESDIIVEESGDDSSDIDCELTLACIICQKSSTTERLSYFQITALKTNTSQIPIMEKLIQVTKTNFPNSKDDHICILCLNLINVIDSLESELTEMRKKLCNMCQKPCDISCNDNISSNENITCFDKENVKQNESVIDNFRVKENIDENKIKENDTVNNSYLPDILNDENVKQKDRICKICNKYFSQTDIDKHKQLHADQINFKCTICHRSFTMKRLLDNHMKKHNGQKDFLCDRCGQTYLKRYSLEIHLRRHKKLYRAYCKQCKKGFVCVSSLKAHQQSHIDIKPFTCKYCNKSFKTNLNEHIKVCSGDLPFPCDKCSKKFVSINKLNNHILLIHEKNYKFQCETCMKGYIKESEYKVHLLTHSNKKLFNCDICSSSYKTIGNLNHHKKIHQQSLPYNCEDCGKGFKRKENFEAHKNKHIGFTPFLCNICNKKFAAQKHLNAHLKIHNRTTEKKSCTICGKQLVHSLAEHMKLHSGTRPFQCDKCSANFITKSALKKHLLRKHNSIHAL